jgi:hypothetical protein
MNSEFRVCVQFTFKTCSNLEKWEKSFKISFVAYLKHHDMPGGQACVESVDFYTECVREGICHVVNLKCGPQIS